MEPITIPTFRPLNRKPATAEIDLSSLVLSPLEEPQHALGPVEIFVEAFEKFKNALQRSWNLNDRFIAMLAGQTPVNHSQEYDALKAQLIEAFRISHEANLELLKILETMKPADYEKIEQLWLSEYPLQPFLAPDQHKSYDALCGGDPVYQAV